VSECCAEIFFLLNRNVWKIDPSEDSRGTEAAVVSGLPYGAIELGASGRPWRRLRRQSLAAWFCVKKVALLFWARRYRMTVEDGAIACRTGIAFISCLYTTDCCAAHLRILPEMFSRYDAGEYHIMGYRIEVSLFQVQMKPIMHNKSGLCAACLNSTCLCLQGSVLSCLTNSAQQQFRLIRACFVIVSGPDVSSHDNDRLS